MNLPGLDGQVHSDTVNALIVAAAAGWMLAQVDLSPTFSTVMSLFMFFTLGYLSFVILPTAEQVAVQYREQQRLGGDDS